MILSEPIGTGQAGSMPDSDKERKVSSKFAFELGDSLQWLNSDPQKIASHRGRIVILLFWNATSVYCHNMLDDLQAIQRKWPEVVSVLAIHIPKFRAELDARYIADVIKVRDINFPVANDADCKSWQHYGAHSWPLAVLIDAQGRIIAEFTGDDQSPIIESHIVTMLKTSAQPALKTPALQAKVRQKSPNMLSAPSGLAIANGLLYVADTGHHRILECTLEGRILREFGGGLPMLLDAAGTDAGFSRPTALTVFRDHIYVADTGNHAVRRIRLLAGYVDTVLGDGRRGGESAEKNVDSARLNNPRGLCVHKESIIVADSGNNRLCLYDLGSRVFASLVGGGAFGVLDGSGDMAQLAHPLALTAATNYLYIIEGSSSSLRSVAIAEGRINTLIGLGPFQYGDADGSRRNAALQHPLAVVHDESREIIWIADAYNRKIRCYHVKQNRLDSLALPQALINPCALALDTESLWIADCSTDQIHRYFFESEYLARISIHSV